MLVLRGERHLHPHCLYSVSNVAFAPSLPLQCIQRGICTLTASTLQCIQRGICTFAASTLQCIQRGICTLAASIVYPTWHLHPCCLYSVSNVAFAPSLPLHYSVSNVAFAPLLPIQRGICTLAASTVYPTWHLHPCCPYSVSNVAFAPLLPL